VIISYQAPLGIAGEKVLELFTPRFERMIKHDIANFKQYVETGRIPENKEHANLNEKSIHTL
jgi:uncharacterized membrane protein